MQATSNSTAQRRKAPRKRTTEPSVVRVETKDGMGNPRWLTADLVDVIDGGCGVALTNMLMAGSTVSVRGALGKDRSGEQVHAGVRWCHEKADGTFRAGLEFAETRSSYIPPKDQGDAAANADALDCYEVLQLSPNADADTVARVYRMLAVRYHPDNPETGNRDMFERLTEAHKILSDPEKRARFDVGHNAAKQLRWKIFDQASATTGIEGEKRKRQGIMALLYSKMLSQPGDATMTIQHFEELLGVPREHLEAALWYLRGKNYVLRGDSGRFSITITGFDEAEAQGLSQIPIGRRLTEAASEK